MPRPRSKPWPPDPNQTASGKPGAVQVATGRVAYDTLAQLNGNLAPADGAQGEVRSDGGNTGTYQKSGPSGSGSWVFKSKATVPALDARTSFAEDDGGLSGYLWALAPNNRLLLAFEEDGTPILKLGRTPLGDGVLDPTFSTLEGDASAEVDAAGRILALCTRDGTWLGKYANPAGVPYALSSDLADQTALLTRINRGLSAYGLPKTEIYGAAFLRECHARFAALLDYDRLYGGTSAQAIIAMQGDSWSTIRDYYVYRLAKRLVAKYGDAGPGWVGFGFTGGGVINACARDDVVSCTKSGSWTSVYGTAPSPDHSAVLSSTPGDRYTVAYVKPSGGPDIATVRLFAVATADGQMRYSFNAGATWTALDLTGSGAKIIDVSGVPAGSWTLWLEHVSGTSNPCGLDLIATTAGVRFHKLGSSGTRSSQWVSSDAATYQAMLAALAPSVIGCLTGTNSQTNYAPEVDRGYTQTLIDRWKAALPASDYFLATPPANNSVGNAYPMSDYAEVHRQLAYGNGLAHLDLQYAFGPDPSQYAFGSSRPLLDATLIHPTQNRGGYVVASRVQRLLEFA